MATYVFWGSLTVTAWVYLGYPLLLLLWRTLRPRPVRKDCIEPTVSIVMAMHDERTCAAAKVENCLGLDYPREKLQIVVALDAPDDGTDFVLEGCRTRGVDIVHLHERKGKAAALNAAMKLAIGEIVVFCDARQHLAGNALRELVANFADESIGAVSGELVLLDEGGKEAADSVGMYWRYEKALRSMESDISSVPGATGAIYAIRRRLFRSLPEGTILDDVLTPLRIALAGKRVVFEPKARAYDRVTASPEVEYQKKTRTLTGNYQLLAKEPCVLLPWRNPILLQFLSHKVGRLVVPHCLVALLISNLYLLHGFYLVCFAAQAIFYSFAAAGWVISTGRIGWRDPALEIERVKEHV